MFSLDSFFNIPLVILALFFVWCAILIYISDNMPRTLSLGSIWKGLHRSDNKPLLPRLSGWSILAVMLLAVIGFIAPQNLPVVLYKISLVVIGGVLGYWLDRALFPYARPHTQYNCANAPVQSMACLRRALIVIACVLGLTMGL